MALTPGARLGPYEIVSLVGVGGMGEVYKGRDTRLNRTVAIKLLPPDVAGRPDRRARFQAEARAISSLSHPHICTLFDVGEQDGLVFLVMEYLEGETLDDRIKRRPLTANEVLQYASQIADALDHAHRAHVMHRDLKPSNVMLTSQGAHLLDFGLARRAAVGTTAGQSTLSVPVGRLTTEGTIVGTLQYMAPEQLEGKADDARTDVFAFGALLFEMATGRKAFEGTSQASLIASILTARPPSISSTRQSSQTDRLPPALDHIVDRCLAKDPHERWQTARDIKLELDWIAGDGSHTDTTGGTSNRRWRSRPAFFWAAANAVTVATLIIVALASGRFRQTTGGLIRFVIAPPAGTNMARAATNTHLALSPDGRYVAFVTTAGVNRLWIQSLDSLTAQAVADSAESPFWSPDSRFVGFFAPGEGLLKKVPVSGGPPRVICSAAIADAPSWHRNGTILFAQSDVGIFRVSAEGGTPTQLTRLDSTQREIDNLWPVWLPDGRHFLYTVTNLDADGRRAPRTVYVGSVDSNDRTLVTRVESRVLYTAPGYLLYVDQGALMAQAFEARRFALAGEPVRIADEVAYNRNNGNAAFDVSETGVLASYTGSSFADLMWFDRAGRQADAGWTHQPFGQVHISPDGQRVIADIDDPRIGSSDVWIYDLSRRVSARLTTDFASETNPVWSPDARGVIFGSDRSGAPDLYFKTTDGLGSDGLVFAHSGAQLPDDWSSDGKTVVFDDNSPETGLDLWVLSLDGERKARPLIRTRFQEWGARFSPDAAWIAFVSNESGTAEVYVAPMSGSGEKQRISTGGGNAPRWRRDGAELFYVATDINSIMAVPVTARPTFKAGASVPLFVAPRLSGSRRRARDVPYDVSPDGQRFLVSTYPQTTPASGITIVLNWTAGLPH